MYILRMVRHEEISAGLAANHEHIVCAGFHEVGDHADGLAIGDPRLQSNQLEQEVLALFKRLRVVSGDPNLSPPNARASSGELTPSSRIRA